MVLGMRWIKDSCSGDGEPRNSIFRIALLLTDPGTPQPCSVTESNVNPSLLTSYEIGWVSDKKGLSAAFLLCAIAFVLTALMATQLPETKGKNLE